MRKASLHGQWSSRFAFVLAATGSAVGLGNIWKFPYIAGENGGGAFVLIYLLCILAIGLPIMVAEIMLGRRGRQSPINTMRDLAAEAGASRFWSWLGWLGVIAGFLILSYYSVIAGWAMAYVVRVASGVFEGATADGVSNIFGQLIADPEKLLAWHSLFMIVTMLVVARGVKGLERTVKFLMPALLVILILLVGFGMEQGAFEQAASFLFKADFSKVSSEGVLTAMGHAFFTLSLGMGAIMVYGSYLPTKVSIGSTAVIIALADTVVALLAGLAIFPIVFANGLEPGSGPGLIFQTLPIAFGHMAYGSVFGTLFFVLLVFAAWSSSISLIEPAVAWLVENKKMSRMRACIWAGLATWILGIGTVLSFNLTADVKLFDKTFFDILDYLTANVMLPLGGLSIAVFAGWVMSKENSASELQLKSPILFNSWLFLVKFVSPVAVAIVFLKAIDVI
ncbi:MAG: sodium-dependent transporter [Cycloclasticus sp.]|jgi:NSS family neurotransmitter:Na+ symporter|nr:MAG: transporter [Cycloclasticus sp. Phe_18]MBV1912354.1 sodium-dependent transporter [Cycloclasticus sp.]MDF1688233.1 sodium-dependent transporter [Cycloclasticus sp.]MEE4290364.1 sodium-dependent transporter [Cycloclasticus sp.]